MYKYTIPLKGIIYSVYRITDTISIRGKSEKIVSIVKFYQSRRGKIDNIEKFRKQNDASHNLIEALASVAN